jgi:hypothetical protein
MKWKKLSLAAIAILTLTIASWTARRFLPLGPSIMSKALCSGRFHQVAHKGTGIATIYQLPDGKRVLSLSKFQTATGPELQVYLIAAADAFENETVETAGFVSLGALESAQGDQTYPLPAGLDLTRYRAVTIWSRKYRVNFTTAPLCPPTH